MVHLRKPVWIRRPSPRDEGYRWPAEWEPHEATFLAWPHDPTTWGDHLEAAEASFAQFAAAIGRGEDVHILVKDPPVESRARRHLSAAGAHRVSLHRVPTRDAWIRDYGPIVVVQGGGETRERLALDFQFNAWGKKYDLLLADDAIAQRLRRIHGLPTKRVDFVLEGGSIDGNGKGTVITSEECLLNPNRNPRMIREEIELQLREHLGTTHVLWLGRGIVGDDTDGHVDDMTRFVDATTVVTVMEEDPADPNHRPLRENYRRLLAMADQDGRPLDVVTLPMPEAIVNNKGRRLPASYANFLVTNRAVCVPVFDQERDQTALRILARCFPKHDVVPIPSLPLVEGFGALHCLSHQLPR